MSAPPQDCQKEACAIQTCLSRTNYNESKCQEYVDKLYRCCAEMYASSGNTSPGSTACPMKTVVDRRMKAMDREGR